MSSAPIVCVNPVCPVRRRKWLTRRDSLCRPGAVYRRKYEDVPSMEEILASIGRIIAEDTPKYPGALVN